MSIRCVVAGELQPTISPAIEAVGHVQINDRLPRFCVYLVLSSPPEAGIGDRRRAYGGPFEYS